MPHLKPAGSVSNKNWSSLFLCAWFFLLPSLCNKDYIRLEKQPVSLFIRIGEHRSPLIYRVWLSLARNAHYVIDAWICLFPPLPLKSVLPTGLSNTARVSLASGIQPVNKPLCLCQDLNSTRANQPVGNTSPQTVTDQCRATTLRYWSKDTYVPSTGICFKSSWN